MSVEEKVLEAVAKVSKRERSKVTVESRIEQLGLDSLDLVTLLFELEESFDIAIPEESVKGVVTVQDIVNRLSESTGGQAASTPA